MKKVQSADGTTIAFDQLGKGPALILVGGALEQRAMDSETAQLAPLLAQHFTVFHYERRGDALALLMLLTGMPVDHLDRVRQHPMWPMWEAVASTLAYDAAVMGEDASVPTEKAASVAVPALVMDGSASYPFMHVTALALVKAMPHAQHRTLEGQTHEVASQ